MTSGRAGTRNTLTHIAGIAHRTAYRIWLCLLAARVVLLIALAGILVLDLVVSRAHAQAPADPKTRKNLYLFGIKCYVANAVSITDQRYNRAGANSDTFRAMARKSYDIIWQLGPLIGKSEDLINEDIDSYQKLLSETYLRDDAFFQRVRYECGRIGLM
jgi:hypothetical protein